MNISGWLQFAIYLAVLLAITKPLGLYLVQVLHSDGKTWLDPVLRPMEKLTYRIGCIDPNKEQDWKSYTISMLIFSLVGLVFTYAILRLQGWLPLNPNPQLLGTPMTPDLAFNTSASFTTNTNWQSYGGEQTMSYFSQMVGLAWHNFTSAAIGIAIAAALVRGIARHTTQTIGNFWVDLVRITYYLLLPICLVYALFLVSQGVVQNFKPYDHAQLVDPLVVNKDTTVKEQVIAQGPVASQIAIKMLGTNGGGFFNANAAHPYENPTPFSNFIQILSIFAIPSALTYYLGRMTRNQAHGWAVWSAMALLFVIGALVCWHSEAVGNPQHQALGVVAEDGNMEGKEVRFGIFNSAFFAAITTDASCGAVNSMHDSFTPLGGLVPLFNIQLGEVVFGGVGAGLYGMLVFVILAVFIAGLMVGRTPEYLGNKIQAYEVKMCGLVVLILTLSILAFSAWACINNWGAPGSDGTPGNGTANSGPHGFSEILYAYSSSTGNNGSAFAGLGANTPWYNTTLALAMLAGRFLMIVPVMALAGSLASKKVVAPGLGTFPVSGPTFVFLLVGTVLLVGSLNFLPALALGPIVEHFLMHAGQTF